MCRPARCSDWAHPRSRGENQLPETCIIVGMGSSPLTRGKQAHDAQREAQRRLIPAHAGKTPRNGPVGALSWAHPRSRGENIVSGDQPRRGPGSSPLTRGKRHLACHDVFSFGLIPAHAGKTALTTSSGPSCRAHPRSRGENRGYRADRGTYPRLIPAHAGKTDAIWRTFIVTPAHPRSRGENRTMSAVL